MGGRVATYKSVGIEENLKCGFGVVERLHKAALRPPALTSVLSEA